jgi:SEC-C motif
MSARTPGRNQTCPCGSGKKWKHCHGSPVSPEASKLPTSAVVPMMGVPGEVQNLVTRNVLAGKPDTATVQWRPYRVQLMLGRPGYPIDPAYTHGFIESRVGNSHLRVVKPLAERKPDDPDKMIWQSVYVDKSGKRIDVQFLGEFNAQGYLGKFSATVEANDANEAAWTAHASLAPLLSSLSASADVPLFIESIDAVEEATGNGLTR